MTPQLPVLSGRRVVQVFERAGWTVARQRGSHIIMIKDGSQATLSVPDHREVARGPLQRMVRSRRASGMTQDDFLGALKKS